MVFNNTITYESIAWSLDSLSGSKVILLVDKYVSDSIDVEDFKYHATLINISNIPLDDFSNFNFKDNVFLYAVDQDDVGLPFIEMIVNKGGKYLAVGVYKNGPYAKMNLDARLAIEEEYKSQTKQGFLKAYWGVGDFENIMQALDMTKHLNGKFVEIGCFNGSSSCMTLNYIKRKQYNIDCYFIDVFDGFVYKEAKDSPDTLWKDTHCTHGYDVVTDRLKKYESELLTVNVIKSNIITDDLPIDIDRIRVANLDVDMYEAVLHGLIKLAPKMMSGGILIVEDPGHTPALIGAKLALEEFCKTEIANDFLPPLFMESGQFFLIRK
jgi:hypothetical protein